MAAVLLLLVDAAAAICFYSSSYSNADKLVDFFLFFLSYYVSASLISVGRLVLQVSLRSFL